MSALEMLEEYSAIRSEANNEEITFVKDINENMLICGMSATASKDEVAHAKTLGMHIFYSKPLDINLIDSVLVFKNLTGEPVKWAANIVKVVENLNRNN